ncbi:hypothetical protein [Fulvivirga lutea]|uniref:Transposase IS200-like domain-containing protein n=1 Tax=Fulvivirga lutea TaxID=2810512 RepID=A0A974WMG8_9BACT|nr:hypothetical protein [Fulvivirga lutea]QSE98975.1 hypothetical protein JR347_07790 [Fulvivirga lutea]
MPDYHSKFEIDNYYHIFNRGNNKEDIFKSTDNYIYFLQKWNKYIAPFADTLAYCLLPNHFHFLMRVKAVNAKNLTKTQRLSKVGEVQETQIEVNTILEEQFKRLFMSYALSFNKQHNRTGSLFQKSFRRIQVNSDYYLTRLIHYIHHNPIHHQFVKEYSQWKFSSYNAFISKETTRLNRDEVHSWFGGKGAFIEFHNQNLELNEPDKELKNYVVDF